MNDHNDDADKAKPCTFKIKIDREHYEVEKAEMTGAELRMVPKPPIGPDRDLFEVVPGDADKLVMDDKSVVIENGKRFFTAPRHINPGSR